MASKATARYLPLLIVAMTGFGCAHQRAQPTDPSEQVYPDGAFDDASESRSFSEELRALGEHKLELNGPDTYRFLWDRGEHPAVSVRISRQGNQVAIVTRALGADDGPRRGPIVTDRVAILSDADWAKFQSKLEKSGFWGAKPSHEPPVTDIANAHSDGAEWVLEGVRDGRYHLMQRWSPAGGNGDKDFAEVCLELVRLGGVVVQPRDVY